MAKNSNLYQIAVPTLFINRPFKKLFSYFAKKHLIIPLGNIQNSVNYDLKPNF